MTDRFDADVVMAQRAAWLRRKQSRSGRQLLVCLLLLLMFVSAVAWVSFGAGAAAAAPVIVSVALGLGTGEGFRSKWMCVPTFGV